jgi:bifunctional non-homologous end joining protein LigD
MVQIRDALLTHYHRKRDFTKTAEPKNSNGFANQQLVIQQHFAKRLHYDLRLEINGVLASWAVTRGPSANPKDKRLAVRTEDHPLSYGSFEGTIPKGQYGGGTVVLWESTTYKPLNGDAALALKNGEIKFESFGSRMRGRWVLVRMKTKERSENWLLIKERDGFAESDDSLPSRFSTGILSGLTPEQISENSAAKQPKKIKSTQRDKIPHFIAPQLCETSETVPTGQDWAFEMKYDGYRIIVAIGGANCVVFTRSGLDWSAKFPTILVAASALPCKSAVLDGEAVIFDDRGLTDFPALVEALDHRKNNKINGVFFDLLELDGNDLRDQAYTERKQKLKDLIGQSQTLRFSDHVIGNGREMFEKVTLAGGEGIIAKKSTGQYHSGRSAQWLKIKTNLRTDVSVIGFMPSTKHKSFASLLAARPTNQGLAYIGRIGTGYNVHMRKNLEPLIATTRPTNPTLANAEKLPRGAQFLAAPFDAEVRYGGWTKDGQMRQARFISVQNDRVKPSPKDKIRAEALPPTTTPWRISHPDRVLFPDCSVTKMMIAQYYQMIWPKLARHLDNRPVSLLRVPEAIDKEVFFQRHALKGMTKGIQTFGPKQEEYFALAGEPGLATAIQFGTVELHGWNAVLPDLEHPDRMIFDLDPDEALPFSAVKSAAQLLRDYLNAAGLECWPLLSGGKGIHLVVPLNQKNQTSEVEYFCGAFAKSVASEKNDIFVATISKAKRSGKILIDYLRNRKKATAIVPWSVRARPGAPIATPVSWVTLDKFNSPRHFTIESPPEDDAWSNFWAADQYIQPKILTTLKGRLK